MGMESRAYATACAASCAGEASGGARPRRAMRRRNACAATTAAHVPSLTSSVRSTATDTRYRGPCWMRDRRVTMVAPLRRSGATQRQSRPRVSHAGQALRKAGSPAPTAREARLVCTTSRQTETTATDRPHILRAASEAGQSALRRASTRRQSARLCGRCSSPPAGLPSPPSPQAPAGAPMRAARRAALDHGRARASPALARLAHGARPRGAALQ
jgi:hypothetical protein